MDKNLELRNLPFGARHSIVQILDLDNSWQKVMDHIPKDPSSKHFERKYNSEHVRLIKQHADDTNRTCSDVLFDEWGTSGKIRPTVKTLLDVLVNAQIFRAADEVAIMLQEPIPKRPDAGPARKISTSVTLLLNGLTMEENSDIKNTDITKRYTSQAVHNGVTKQMKSVNLIQFTSKVDNKEIKSYGKQTTAQMVSNNDDLPQVVQELCTNEMPDLPEFNEDKPKTNEESTPKLSPLGSNNSSMFYPSSSPHMAPGADLYNVIDRDILENPNLVQFHYEELQNLTNNFTEAKNETQNGPIGKIGSGGFGDVFAAYHAKYGTLAVKRVRCINPFDCKPDMVIKIFNNEVVSLSHLHHVNIVPILGYSINGPLPCIICKYIEGGNLEQKLATKVLNEKQRMDIIIGSAEGLKYIHNTVKPLKRDPNSNSICKKIYFLHGDVKSANILLTNECIPKLCDFGLAKQLETTFLVSSMIGTSAYMPLEAFNGTLTRKTDIYSFGIVLLEILTGLRPIVANDGDEKINIKSYIEESVPDGIISSLLDKVVGNWSKAQNLYNLAKHCLELNRNRRPSMDEICIILHKINQDDSFTVPYNQVS
ncbi:hypothetical protein K1T71_005724 [Dendrolimus kikuchii]|uniref:Uncharacterized protein n=1 Tax=Dendrolimus kikuchii TaxID=765133 RepID=A0ACC1D4U4_9NEOP|nr:hypothetical protein K1T71_005724 [Dendrolimus kikuchii]